MVTSTATAEPGVPAPPRPSAGRRLARTLAGRLAQGVVVVWAAVTVAFVAVQLAPGDTVDTLLGENRDNPALRAAVIAEWGLDQPAVVQYLSYLGRLLRGDLGTSYALYRPITDIFAEQLPPTLVLALTGLALAVVIAVTGSLLTSGRHGWGRTVSQAVELVVISTPSFWLGMVLLAVFSFRLGWFPVAGGDGLNSLVLPAGALGVPAGALLTQILREGIDRALEQPFALTSRSRGLTVGQVKSRHALRHASLPALTIVGMMAGTLVGGAVIVETVFGRPGIGQVAVAAIHAQDMPVILAVVLAVSIAFVLMSLVVDLLYTVLDPRLRQSR